MILSGPTSTAATADSGRAVTDQQKLDNDLNRFLTLLVTQLQNQDPLEPLDANEFTAQLVQFASVEQQIYQNANLEKILAAQTAGQTASMVQYLGTTVEVDGHTLALQDGFAAGTYTLPEASASTFISIRDESGAEVSNVRAATTAGPHEFGWTGLGSDGRQLPDGAYTFEVIAKDRQGQPIEVRRSVVGRVTETTTENGAVVLGLDDVRVPLDRVLRVRESPSPLAAAAAAGD